MPSHPITTSFPSLTSLNVLSKRVVESANKIEASFAHTQTSKSSLQSFNVPAELSNARRELIEAAQEIQIAASGPVEFLEAMTIHYQWLSALRWLLHFDVFGQLPQDLSPVSYETLASKTGAPLPRLQSVARMAMTSGLFTEKSSTSIAHNTLSLSLDTDPLLKQWAHFMTCHSAPAANAFADATVRWGNTTLPNETAYNMAFQIDKPFFEHMETTPGLAEEFAGYEKSQSRLESDKLDHLVQGFNWSNLKKGVHVVDIGGSDGQTAIALATAHPDLTLTVQDLPEVIEGAKSTLKDAPESVSSRIEFIARDFFSPQPDIGIPKSTKSLVYVLRKVIHDWNDEKAKAILSQIAVAMEANSAVSVQLLIMDIILPPPSHIGRIPEAALRVGDLSMAQLFNSRERELEQWEDLIHSVKPKLTLKDWVQPNGSSMALIDVRLAK